MKRKSTLIYLGLTLTGCLLVWLVLRAHTIPTPSVRAKSAKIEDPIIRDAIEEDNRIKRVNPKKWEEYHRHVQHDWSMPISFYGKVVDETGSSVAGAKIKFAWTDLSPSGASHQDAVSDELGLFNLEGVHGKNLGVSVAKEGYFASHRDPPGFEYADHNNREFHVPNPANPVIFHLWRKSPGEKLIYQHTVRELSYDHEGYYYDLQSGTVTPEASLGAVAVIKISVTRSRGISTEAHEWSCTVSAVNGGLRETTEEFPFLAPADGYEPSWEFSEFSGTPGYKGHAHICFYFRANEGRYGRIDFSVSDSRTRESGAHVVIDSFLNPSGSRILEPK